MDNIEIKMLDLWGLGNNSLDIKRESKTPLKTIEKDRTVSDILISVRLLATSERYGNIQNMNG
jgi:hypothetical protein